MKYLGGMDTMFVRAETRSVLLHVTGVMVLEPGTRAEEVRDRIRRLVVARLSDLPPLRWRLVEPPGGIGALRWVDDPDFDVARHVHLATAPAPGSWRDLEEAAGVVAAEPLDRSRPLWEMHVLDGLADGSVAIIGKFHHAFMDGGAGLELMAALFDLEPEPSAEAPEHDPTPERIPTWWELLAATPVDVAKRLSKVPAALTSLAGVGGLVGAMLPQRGADGSVAPAQRVGFNGTLSDRRAVALASCALSDVKAVAAAFDVTVNDVVLAAVAAALRDPCGPHGTGPDVLIAAVPVSVHAAHPDDRFGNHTSAMMIQLPVDIDDPASRLEAVGAATRAAKAEHTKMGVELLERWAGVVPPWLISTGARLAARLDLTARLPLIYNLIVSNVAGPSFPIYLAGSEVVATYPLGPLLDGAGLNISVLSQKNRIHLGIICDPALVPDPSRLGTGFADAVGELFEASATSDPVVAGHR